MAKIVQVAIVMGSTSDNQLAESAASVLAELGVKFETRILSAHRTPDELAEFAKSASGRGIKAVIAIAGMSAALSGVVAANTQIPVIAVPAASGALGGLDALLSSSQMPPGVPVACMAVGDPGARNAAIFATEILALSDEKIKKSLAEYRAAMKKKVLSADRDIHEK